MIRLLVISCILLGGFAANARADEQVRLSLEWLVSGRHVGYFAAKEKGFYQEEGLDVTIDRGYGSADSVKRIATESTDFAVMSVASLIAAKSKADIPVTLVASFFNKGPEAILFLKNSGITTPKDLAGKRIASSAISSSFDLFQAFVDKTKISGYQSVMMSSDQTVPALLTGQTDAMTGFVDMIATLRPVVKRQGNDVEMFTYADFGVDTYGSGIVVNTKRVLAKDPVIQRFLRATLKGIAWSIQHPKESVTILKKQVPTINESNALATWEIDIPMLVTEETKQHGLGYLSSERMAVTREMVRNYMGVNEPIAIDKVFTSEFIPKVPVP